MARKRRLIMSSPLVPGLLAGVICLILGTGAFGALGVGLVVLVVFAAMASAGEPAEAARPVRRPVVGTSSTVRRRPSAPVRATSAERASRIAA
jgi:hypothetical protein